MATSAIAVNAVMAARKNQMQPQAPRADRPDSAIPISGDLSPEEKAALLIGRTWRRKREGLVLDRKIFMERLYLENDLCVGLVRLVCFISIFLLLIFSNSLSTSSDYRRQVSLMVENTLGIDEWREIGTLEGVRDYLPNLSSRMKGLSAATNQLFPDPNALEILTDRVSFTNPVALQGVSLPVTGSSFTFIAWVDAAPSRLQRRTIIRKPLNPASHLSCFAWSHPATFTFGAHDFHSLDTSVKDWEELLQVPGTTSGLTHEALVVDAGTVSFFRNGVQLGNTITLPRALTDCDSTFFLGDQDLSLAAVKFYPRALLTSEIQETYSGGQPLSELASGSSLPRLGQAELLQVVASAQQGTSRLSQELETHGTDNDAAFNILSQQLETHENPNTPDPIFPDDPSPPAVLITRPGSALTAREKAAWEAAGSPRTPTIAEQWRTDSGMDRGTYWAFLDSVVYGDETLNMASLPSTLPSDLTEVTFTYWSKPLLEDREYGCHFELAEGNFMSPINSTADRSKIRYFVGGNYGHYMFTGGWDKGPNGQIEMFTDFEGNPDTWAVGDYAMAYSPSEYGNGLDQKFFHTIRFGRPQVVAWRMMAFTLNTKTRAAKIYLDGKKHLDTTTGNFRVQKKRYIRPGFKLATYLQGLKYQHYGNSRDSTYCKIGDTRMYTKELTEAQLVDLMNTATWSNGKKMKQCADLETDNDWVDSVNTDQYGRSCRWFAEAVKFAPEVCASTSAKTMCPVTCRGRRQCHDGTLFYKYTPPPVQKSYRVFDRVMHIKPSRNTTICPSKSLVASEVVAECRKLVAAKSKPANSAADGWYDFLNGFTNSWVFMNRLDLWDCDELEKRLEDGSQCIWDDSWLAYFTKDFADKNFFRMSLWIRPVAGSRGMPTNFFPSMHLYSRLASPYALLDIGEQNPIKEDLLRTWIASKVRSNILIGPTGINDFTKGWTLYTLTYEKKSDGSTIWCLGLNAMPLNCYNDNPGGIVDIPAAFLQGIEFTTEMLEFYDMSSRMEDIVGPIVPEVERIASYIKPQQKEQEDYNEAVALIAPPLLFQTRSPPGSCAAGVPEKFKEAQFALVKAAHCSADGLCPSLTQAEQVFSCIDGSDRSADQLYFGLKGTELFGQEGYSEFLYSVADNSVLVRDGETLPARNFIDGKTQEATILAVFQAPETGLTSLLKLQAVMEGPLVVCSVSWQHLGYLTDESRNILLTQSLIMWIVMILLALYNLFLLYLVFEEKRMFPEIGLDKKGIFGVIYDLVQMAVVGAFNAVTYPTSWNSKADALKIVGELVAVPFADPAMAFETKISSFFAAVEGLDAALKYEEFITNFAFSILVLMLIRIVWATAVHPRTGVLTGTIMHGLDDLWHFALLFFLVFMTFSITANWMFGAGRSDFKDLETSMTTQFEMLLGSLPEDFRQDNRMIVYVVLTNIVQFFLMLNFLLAIVVEAYMKVREHIEEHEAENEVSYDIVVTLKHYIQGVFYGWPGPKKLARLVQQSVATKRLAKRHLIAIGVPYKKAVAIVAEYHRMEALQSEEPAKALNMSSVIKCVAAAAPREGSNSSVSGNFTGKAGENPHIEPGQTLLANMPSPAASSAPGVATTVDMSSQQQVLQQVQETQRRMQQQANETQQMIQRQAQQMQRLMQSISSSEGASPLAPVSPAAAQATTGPAMLPLAPPPRVKGPRGAAASLQQPIYDSPTSSFVYAQPVPEGMVNVFPG